MHLAGFILTCLSLAPAWFRPASPNPDDLAVPAEIQVKSRALVRQLGSGDYTERESAQQQLAALGRLAKPALLAGVNTSPSQEVRLRCAELLPRATAIDLRARINTFLADTQGKYEHDLPAWNAFRAMSCREWSVFGQTLHSNGAQAEARRVFARLLAGPTNRRLLMAVNGSPLELSELVAIRQQELYSRRYARAGDEANHQEPTLEDITTLLFTESMVGSQYFPRRGSITSLLSSTGFTSLARGTDETAHVYRSIAVAWLESRNDPREMYQAMGIATNLDLTDQTCALAVRLMVMPSVSSTYRGRAASNLVNYGGKRHIPLLNPALSSSLVIYTVRKTVLIDGGEPEELTYQIQVRDLALAVSLILSKQKLEDYGFADRYSPNPDYDYQSFRYSQYYFPDEATRKKAFAKWERWRKANPDE